MDKRQKVKKKPTKAAKEKPVQPAKAATSEPEGDKFDFGGLPERNLKKNLGCG